MANAVNILVSADTRRAINELDRTKRAVSGVGTSADRASKHTSRLGSLLGVGLKAGAYAAAGGVTALGYGMYKAVGAASDMSESINKANVVFGKSSGTIKKFGDQAAESLGISKQAAIDATSTFGVFGKSSGLAGKDLTAFSTSLVKAASDMASFHNADPTQVLEDLRSGLAGETEPLRKYGILLNDATLRQEALKLGLVKTTKDALSPQNKMLAAQRLILERLGPAYGDFERTSGGLANQQRILRAKLADVTAELGERLLPVALEVVGGFNDILGFVDKLTHAKSISMGINLTMRSAGRVVTSIQDALFGSTTTRKIKLPGGDFALDTTTTEGLVDRFWEAIFDPRQIKGRRIKIGKGDVAFATPPDVQQSIFAAIIGAHEGEDGSDWLKRQWDEAVQGFSWNPGTLINKIGDSLDLPTSEEIGNKVEKWLESWFPTGKDVNRWAGNLSKWAFGVLRQGVELPFQAAGAYLRESVLDWKGNILQTLTGFPAPLSRIIGRIIKRVTDPFGDLPGTFTRIFDKVKNSITSKLSDIASTISGWIGDALSPVNSVLDFLHLPTIPTPGPGSNARDNTPGGGPGAKKHAKGAIVNPRKEGVYVVAEGGYPEAVLSLDPKYKNRTLDLINEVMARLGVAPQYARGGIIDPLTLPWVYAPRSQTEFRAHPEDLRSVRGRRPPLLPGEQVVWREGREYGYIDDRDQRVNLFSRGHMFQSALRNLSPFAGHRIADGEAVAWYRGQRVVVPRNAVRDVGFAYHGSAIDDSDLRRVGRHPDLRPGEILITRDGKRYAYQKDHPHARHRTHHHRKSHHEAFPMLAAGGLMDGIPRFAGGGIAGGGNHGGNVQGSTFASVTGAVGGVFDALLHPVEWLKKHLPNIPQNANRLVMGVLGHVKDALVSKITGLFGDGKVGRALAEAKRIDALNLPYVWGGGHQSSPAPSNGPFDCSGFVSHILQFAGINVPTMVSGAFMSAGSPGRGPLEVLANPEHIYMGIAGNYYGTSSYNPGGGPGALPYGERPGFTIRHFGNGGIVPGAPGQPQLAVVHGGEHISRRGGHGGMTQINIPVYATNRRAILRQVDTVLTEAGIA